MLISIYQETTVDGLPNWAIELNLYKKSPKTLLALLDDAEEAGSAAKIFGYRAMNRRVRTIRSKISMNFYNCFHILQFIPMGLVLLSRACSDILLGKITVSSSEGFKAMWLECIKTFDDLYQDDDDDDSGFSQLFRTVSVCGNGYGICKKIEALLKLVFTLPHEQTMVSHRLQTDTAPSSSHSNSSRRSSAAYIGAPPDAVSLKYLPSTSSSRPVSGNLPRSAGSSRPHSSSFRTSDHSGSTPRNAAHAMPGIATTSMNEQEVSRVIEDVEDVSIGKAAAEGTEAAPTSTIPPNTDVVRVKGRNKGLTMKQVNQSIDKSIDIDNKSQQMRLIDYYPHFSMIFPVTYHTQGSTK